MTLMQSWRVKLKMGEAGDIIRASRKKKETLAQTKASAQKVIAARTPKKKVPTSQSNKNIFGGGAKPKKSTFEKVKEGAAKIGKFFSPKQQAEEALGIKIEAGAAPAIGGIGSGFGAAGKWLPAKSLKLAKSNAQLVKAGTKVAKVGGKINPKTAVLAEGLLAKVLKPKTLLAAGGALAGAASSLFLGLWAQAEAPEPLSIVMRDVLAQAQKTGDFSLYEESAEARDDIIDLNIWEKIAKWSPLSPIIGIPNKIKGVAAAAQIQDQLAKDMQIQAETGETEDDKWARVREQQAQEERDNIDYYNEKRKEMLDWEQEAKANQRNEDAAFWAKEAEKQRKLEEEDRQAIADFWQAYREEAARMADDNRPSNLNFGLL